MQHLSDEQLVVLVLQGQSEAFAILVERYQKQIFALAYRLGGDYDEARDMAQEAFVRIYQELSRFDSSRRFFPWMYRVAHNTCVNILHKRPKETTPLEAVYDLAASDTSDEGSPVARYEQLELGDAINGALQSLPEKYRFPLILKYLEENILYGDYSSGTSRIMESILTAVSVAIGIGVSMGILSYFWGGLV